MSYDPIKMRGVIRKAHQQNGRLKCAWCGGNISAGFDPHHALVKRSECNHSAIHSECNIVPLHRECHSAHGQSAEMTVKALDYLIDRLGAERVARWYISLWRDHGLSVARGTLPKSSRRYQCAWCEYESDRDGICPNDDILCRGENHQLQWRTDFDAATEQEWREYLELVCLPLCCAA